MSVDPIAANTSVAGRLERRADGEEEPVRRHDVERRDHNERWAPWLLTVKGIGT